MSDFMITPDPAAVFNVGRVTSYADAVAGGYQGTREEWEIVLANLGTTAAEVEANRQAVAEDKAAVEGDVTTVGEYKEVASAAAAAALQSAESAHTDALAATAAKEAAQTAQGIAEEAKEAAAASKTAAENAQTEAGTSASAAAGSALVAQNAAQTATTQAGAAADSAAAAAASATAAAESARTLTIDTTLTQAGQAADAKKAGDAVTDLKSAFSDFGGSVSDFTNYAIYRSNLVKYSEYVDNAYLLMGNGDISPNHPGYFVTGFIPVTAGVRYKSNVGRNNAWYDSNKVFISSTSGDSIQRGVYAPENAAYIRFVVNKVNDGISTPLMLYFTDLESYGDDVVFGHDIGKLNASIVGNQFNANLVIPYDCVSNAYIIVSSGALSPNHPGYFATGFIPVTAGTIYKSNVGRNWAWYDTGKTFISGTSGTAIQSGTTAPDNAAYIRFSVNIESDGIESPYKLYFTDADSYKATTIPGLDVQGTTLWCKNKKINWIGDSIVDGQDFDEIVCDTLGIIKESEYGINGSTIALNGDGTNTRNAICLRYADMSDDADIIAVSAGTNDWMYAWSPIGTIESYDNTTFYGALKTLCNGLITKYPQKTIFFTTPIKRAQAFENGNGGEYTADGVNTTPFSKNKYGKTLMDYADIIKEVCAYYSIPVLDLYRESMLNPHIVAQQSMFDSALTHPNDAGRKLMARRACGWITQLSYSVE